ncbi:MAG: mechanosensitive ion channel [Sandaracinaceae bacterium]|nr:mechanosensitive ion channel [Sandaracinaceae bacterium]
MEYFEEFVALLRADLFRLGETRVTSLSLLILAVAIGASFYLGRAARVVIKRVLIAKAGVAEGTAYAVGRVAQYVILIGGIVFGLDNVGFDITAFAAFGAVISVGIGFGLQNIAQNFISGLILLIERPVQKGDFIELGGVAGFVAEIEMRATRIITRDGISVLVPNSELIAGRVHNVTAPDRKHRIRVSVGVAYGSDTAAVREVLLGVAAAQAEVLADPAPAVFFVDFGDSSLDFQLCVWLGEPAPVPRVASELRFAIDAAFRERGIEIPFPQRDLHVKSGLDALTGRAA